MVPNGQVVDIQLLTGTLIEGTVFEHDGKPVSKGSVQVFHDQQRIHTARCGKDGKFAAVVDPALNQSVELRVYVHETGGRRTASLKATPGATGLVIRMPAPQK